MNKLTALRAFAAGVFGRNNLTGSDFEDIKATRIKAEVRAGNGGLPRVLLDQLPRAGKARWQRSGRQADTHRRTH